MKQELEQQLINNYPKLFKQTKLAPTQSCMYFGVECGSGWFNIIERACCLIQNHIDQTRSSSCYVKRYNRALKQAINGNNTNLRFHYKKLGYKDEVIEEYVKRDLENKSFRQPFREVTSQLEFTQIKEKFGTLRIYTVGGDDYCHGAIDMAEGLSSRICEDCGNPGKIRPGGWIKTLCDTCDLERKSKK